MGIDDAPADDAREADVGQRGERHAGVAHRVEREQRRMRSGAVVRSDRRDAELREPPAGSARVDAAARLGLVVEREQRHDRQRRRSADGLDRGDELVEVEERLDHEQVDAAALEHPRLLGVQRPVLARVEHLELAERPDRAGDQHVTAGDIARLACQADARRVDRLELVLEELACQLAAVGAEGVRLDQLGTGADVARVHGDHALGRAEVRLLRATQPGRRADQERPHAAVGHDRRAGAQSLEEIRHPPSLLTTRIKRCGQRTLG